MSRDIVDKPASQLFLFWGVGFFFVTGSKLLCAMRYGSLSELTATRHRRAIAT